MKKFLRELEKFLREFGNCANVRLTTASMSDSQDSAKHGLRCSDARPHRETRRALRSTAQTCSSKGDKHLAASIT